MKSTDKKSIDLQCASVSLEEKERYCSIVESLPDLICSFSSDGKPTYVNQAFCDFLEKPRADLLSGNILDLIPVHVKTDIMSALNSISPANPTTHYIQNPDQDHPDQWFSWNVRGVFDNEGNVLEYHAIGRDVSELRQAEERHQESAQDYEDIVERSPDMIHSVDNDGHILFANKRECDLLGYDRNEIVGMHIFDLYAPEERKRIETGFEKLKKEGKLHVSDGKMLKKNGEIFLVDIDSTAVADSRGNFVRTRSIIRDVTSKKKHEMEAQASEHKYRIVVENANEVILVAQDNMIRFANPKAAEVTGYTLDEIYSQPFTQFIHPDDQKMVAERYKKRLMGESTKSTYIFRIITKTKDTRWLEIHSVKIDWEGKPATLSFLTDVTEREKAAHSLKRSEALYRSIFDQAIDAIVLINMDGVFSQGNQVFKRQFGYTETEYKKLKITDIEAGMTPDEVSQKMAYVKDHGSDTYETQSKTKTGKIIDVLISMNLVRLDGEDFFHAIFRDITIRKQAENELNQKIEQMEFMGRLNIKRHKKMLDMQKEIIDLKRRLGESPPSMRELDEFNAEES